jgi:hypothetical protein
MRHYIACAQRGESGEGKVHTIHQGAGEITLQIPPAIGPVHQEKGNGENPHLDGVGGERDKYAHDDSKPMRYFHPGHQQGDLVQKFIMNHHGKADHKKIYEDNGYHLFLGSCVGNRVLLYLFYAATKKPRGWMRLFILIWCPETESNCRHGDFQSPALPTELSGRNACSR